MKRKEKQTNRENEGERTNEPKRPNGPTSKSVDAKVGHDSAKKDNIFLTFFSISLSFFLYMLFI
jgi:hypothetical protein